MLIFLLKHIYDRRSWCVFTLHLYRLQVSTSLKLLTLTNIYILINPLHYAFLYYWRQSRGAASTVHEHVHIMTFPVCYSRGDRPWRRGADAVPGGVRHARRHGHDRPRAGRPHPGKVPGRIHPLHLTPGPRPNTQHHPPRRQLGRR